MKKIKSTSTKIIVGIILTFLFASCDTGNSGRSLAREWTKAHISGDRAKEQQIMEKVYKLDADGLKDFYEELEGKY